MLFQSFLFAKGEPISGKAATAHKRSAAQCNGNHGAGADAAVTGVGAIFACIGVAIGGALVIGRARRLGRCGELCNLLALGGIAVGAGIGALTHRLSGRLGGHRALAPRVIGMHGIAADTDPFVLEGVVHLPCAVGVLRRGKRCAAGSAGGRAGELTLMILTGRYHCPMAVLADPGASMGALVICQRAYGGVTVPTGIGAFKFSHMVVIGHKLGSAAMLAKRKACCDPLVWGEG